MANQNSAKGNPASKRMSNSNLKARRERSWKRGQERKAQRIEDQQKVAAFFRKEYRDNGSFRTPGQLMNAARMAAREGTVSGNARAKSLRLQAKDLRASLKERGLKIAG